MDCNLALKSRSVLEKVQGAFEQKKDKEIEELKDTTEQLQDLVMVQKLKIKELQRKLKDTNYDLYESEKIVDVHQKNIEYKNEGVEILSEMMLNKDKEVLWFSKKQWNK